MDTEEQAFWSHLEANPSDSVARLVFADWLQERGDLRAEGMRVIGTCGIQAGLWYREEPHWGYWLWMNSDRKGEQLPNNWWNRFFTHLGGKRPDSKRCTVALIESAAALAWLDLTQEERDGICKLD